jgi:hypothetical protein
MVKDFNLSFVVDDDRGEFNVKDFWCAVDDDGFALNDVHEELIWKDFFNVESKKHKNLI